MSAEIEVFEAPMRRALELALLGPVFGVNPQVGAVIVDSDGKILAEGWHLGSGTDHAEVAALKELAAKGITAVGLTAVVTLEPCNHTGKTPPCTQALIDAGVSRVVFAVSDPGDESANGAKTLRKAGIEVVEGVLTAEAEEQGRIWLTANRLGRPFVTLKWAASLDGRSAAEDGTSKWISGAESRADTHQRRALVDAILVGTRTVLADDPELTARKTTGELYDHQPLRVILGETKIKGNYRILNDAAPTVHYETRSIHGALAELWARGVHHVWVEGGPKVASKFVKLGLVDEFLIYQAAMLIGGDRTSLRNIGVDTMVEAIQLEYKEVRMLGEDVFIRAVPKPRTSATKKKGDK
ncbi:MAG: bifunctional diaminohydroxyphosphoribosylaminopyrimidine [Actinomycetota bacterium]|jgi:diaminohydroxyphosphoribosylaminopyrimidine deaminase/5-amino-6-(5-phosphoribosylamino)uracil reductase